MFSRSSARADDFESAAMPHLNDLFRTALRVIGDRSVAEDLVQETFLQAWKSFHRFEMGTNCRAWLFKILLNVVHHHRRRWYNSRTTIDTDDLLEDTVPYEAPIPQHLSDEEVLAALEAIPSQYREVILLADVEEFSYKEIATALGIPVGTVMSRLSRGRRLLRKGLKEFAVRYRLDEEGKSA